MPSVSNILFYRVDRSDPDQTVPDYSKPIRSISMLLVASGAISRYIFTTLDVPKAESMDEVRHFHTEMGLLKAFFQFWKDKHVQILHGFGNHAFDNKQLVARRIHTGISDDGISLEDLDKQDAFLFASNTMRSVDMVDVVRNTFGFQGEDLQFSSVCHSLLEEPAYGFPEDMEVAPADYVYANFENTEKLLAMLTKTDEHLQKTGERLNTSPLPHHVLSAHPLK
jgi:DNA polymerase elongation subunit (family B)